MTEVPHKTKPFRDYDEGLMESLKQSSEAAAYLNAALEEGDKSLFLTALGNVARAHGFTTVSQATDLNRVALYRMLSESGNPELSSLDRLLHSFGLKLAVEVVDNDAA